MRLLKFVSYLRQLVVLLQFLPPIKTDPHNIAE